VGGRRHTQDGSRERRLGRRKRKEEKRRGNRVVERRSQTIRHKTFKTPTSSSDALSLDVQTFKNRLYPWSKMRAKTYQITSEYLALLPAFCSLVLP